MSSNSSSMPRLLLASLVVMSVLGSLAWAQQPPPVPLPAAPAARHLGDLARSQTRWSVYLETRLAGSLAQGRLHFVDGPRHKSTGWIFREWTVPDVRARFAEFSPLELWRLLESLS